MGKASGTPLPHFLLPQAGGSRKKSTGASACPTQGLPTCIPTWPIRHLSGPSLSARLFLVPWEPAQHSSLCAQVSIFLSERAQPMVWQI